MRDFGLRAAFAAPDDGSDHKYSDGSAALTVVDLDWLLSSAAAGDSLSRREYEALARFARERLTALCDRRVPTSSADSVDSESWSVPFAPTVDATFREDLAGADANALVLVPRRPDEPAGKCGSIECTSYSTGSRVSASFMSPGSTINQQTY
ncbi:hypothetical protein ATCC90586_007402 [Pythium insidiosum]|nr:hypothetical protein ATCC90586_007402 [Pythium insidiosum]